MSSLPAIRRITVVLLAVSLQTGLAAQMSRRGGMGGTMPGAGGIPAPAQQSVVRVTKIEHAVVGEVSSIDPKAATLVITTPEGAHQIVTFTPETTARLDGTVAHFSDAATQTALSGKTVLVRFSSTGFDTVALTIVPTGTGPLALSKGTLVSVDEGGTLVVRTLDGTEVTAGMTATGLLDGPKGLRDGVPTNLKTLKAGGQVTLYGSRDGSRTLVQLLKHS